MGKAHNTGYIRLSRKFLDHWIWNIEREFSYAEAWIDLIQSARYNHGTKTEWIGNNLVTWDRGQFPASLRFLKERWGWSSLKRVKTFLDRLEKETMIATDSEQGQTVITICNYEEYNRAKDTTETPTENEEEQKGDRVETDGRQNSKKDVIKDIYSGDALALKKVELETKASEVLSYLNLKANRKFKNFSEIIPRLKEGYTVEDCKQVIDVKVEEWKNSDMKKYLRPETLFCKKHFDSYLNQEFTPAPAQPNEGNTSITIADYNQLFGIE